ncbi:MAG: class I SAM-dependent methyltransferase [Bacillota bacterium]
MSENTTPHKASEYDGKVSQVIPGYGLFHEQIIDLIRCYNSTPGVWLDTGCGTGSLVLKAYKRFVDTSFILADPSASMLKIAKEKLAGEKRVRFLDPAGTQELALPENSTDVVTAVMSHHYLDNGGRKKATANCFRMLKKGGLFITFENIRPSTEEGIQIGLERWKKFQTGQGRSEEEAKKHLARFDAEFFPVTIGEHLNLLRETGFKAAEILWASYMQAGFYAIK